MPVNNLTKILPLLKFESEDDFYYLQILQRKKENAQLGSNSRVIKNYYIKSQEDLTSKWSEIVNLCETFNARASLRLNKRSFEKVAFRAMVNVANSMSNREYKFIRSCYDRACGESHNDKEKKWILDVDNTNDTQEVSKMISHIYDIEPIGNKVVEILSSKSGYHIITSPFNLAKFKEFGYNMDVHKDNPTNLYIP